MPLSDSTNGTAVNPETLDEMVDKTAAHRKNDRCELRRYVYSKSPRRKRNPFRAQHTSHIQTSRTLGRSETKGRRELRQMILAF